MKLFTNKLLAHLWVPLFPLIISDIVMEDLEERVLNFLQFRVSAYFRYVDDVFMIASKDKVTQILNSFNE